MEKEQKQDAYLFQVTNHHGPSSGIPPQVDDKQPRRYRGYFENEFGEQAIFIYDYDSKQATLRMGDTEWETVYLVQDNGVPGLILDHSELLWLAACWKAATCFKKNK
jgi:hypothetical protein